MPESAPMSHNSAHTTPEAASVPEGAPKCDGTQALEYGLVAQDAWKIGAETILLAVEAAAASETGGASHEDVLLDPAWIDATALEAQTQAEYLY